MFNNLTEELKKTKNELIEANLDIWEYEFDKERINALEGVIHEQKNHSRWKRYDFYRLIWRFILYILHNS